MNFRSEWSESNEVSNFCMLLLAYTGKQVIRKFLHNLILPLWYLNLPPIDIGDKLLCARKQTNFVL